MFSTSLTFNLLICEEYFASNVVLGGLNEVMQTYIVGVQLLVGSVPVSRPDDHRA